MTYEKYAAVLDENERLKAEIAALRGGLLQCLQHWLLNDDPQELQEAVKNLKALSEWEAALVAAKEKK